MQWMRRRSALPVGKACQSAIANAGKTRAEEERRPLEHLQREEMRIECQAMAASKNLQIRVLCFDSRPEVFV
jgi:hypothetical protein